LRHKLYYGIKPLVPVSVRLGIRRWFALRKREKVRDVWPILAGSERPLEDWPGWPDGKPFALVLTHDVEGPAGLAKVRKLVAVEQKLGFRSSFNFIPEGGQYAASKALGDELAANGFEIGVHDLYHDGKLFLRRKEFSRNAVKINRYLHEWGAAGFRSGFMLHNLDWMHELDIQYDSSTFDTDPFEPQPQGLNTIFPFWVPRAAPSPRPRPSTLGPGYAELPYTLPQDFTLFLLLGERHPDIWFQKLDWIAKHGGMALVNVHPDYLRFEGEAPSSRTYPAELYGRFLEYARQRHGTSFWQPLPKEMAAFVAQRRLKPRPKPKRICMVTYSHFLSDARVARYAEALAERGDHVDVLALGRSAEEPTRETVRNINLFRIQPRYDKNQRSWLAFAFPTVRFFLASSLRIARQHASKGYDLLHIHNLPDFLVFCALVPKLTGAKVILDIHDIMPEFYGSKFNVRERSLGPTVLKWVERASARFADQVIISNPLWKDRYSARTGANGKCSVFINNVDAKVFHRRPRTRSDEKLLVLFPGGLHWHQGLDIAIRAFSKVKSELPTAEFHIYGEGNMRETLVQLASDLGLNGSVRFFNPLPVREVAEIMANADLGVVPKRADSFGNEAFSTKIMEFMSLGVPVVVSSTKIDRFYFDDSTVCFFESGNVEALAQAMIDVLRDVTRRRSMVEKALAYAARNSWESRKGSYLELVDSLAGGRRQD
jgi:glycosyltransferase involved in cell wall biosynthesis/peptidoglycan/xylan/chitin deacetylase (PgdA/CDA1 family)